MDSPKPKPLSLDEAKARFRTAAALPLLSEGIREHPLTSVLLALEAGVLAGGVGGNFSKLGELAVDLALNFARQSAAPPSRHEHARVPPAHNGR